MTEDELRRLDGNLASQRKALEEEIAKLTEQIDEKGFFKRLASRNVTKRSKNKLRVQRAKMRDLSGAIERLQTAMSVSDPTKRASKEVQERAYNELIGLENTINFEGADTPLRVSTNKARTSLGNTLQTLFNRHVGTSYGRIFGYGALAIVGIPIVAGILSQVGLPALIGSLTPAIWGAVGFAGVRTATHAITKFVRNRIIKSRGEGVTYESLYPTMGNVKGFANLLSYFRGLRRNVGKRFDAMTDSDLLKRYKTSGFAPVSLSEEERLGEEKGDKKDADKALEASIAAIVGKVVALDVTKKEDVDKFYLGEFSAIYAALSATPDVKINNKDLLELCNSYLTIVRAAHEGKINETALQTFLNMEGTSENFKSLHDDLVMRLESLLEGIFKDTLSDSIREMFDKYKHAKKGKEDGEEGDKPDPDDLDDEEKKKKKTDPPKPEPTRSDLTPEKVKEEMGKIIDKMSRSTTSVDFTESLKELNELIKNAKDKGVVVTYDEETKMMLTMLRSYTNFSEAIRSGIYDNAEFYTNLRNFLNPENEVGSDRVREFRSILIRQLNSLVREELKINDSRLTGLIDYGFTQRTRGSFGTTAAQVALIQNLEKFDYRNFSPENIALARNMLDEIREIDRMKTPENEFHLDHAMSDRLTNLEMFSSVARDRERLGAQIKACQSIIGNPAGYAEADARATIENCVRTYYHVVGFVNHVLSNEYANYTYQDRNGNSKTRTFDENGIGAAIDLKLLNASQINSLKKIMEFYKNSELRATTGMSSQSQYMDEQLSGYKARR